MRYSKTIAFTAMAAIIFMMIVATIIEKNFGTASAFQAVYNNKIFIFLWALVAVFGLIYFFSRKGQGIFTALIHCSLVVILAGALITHIWGNSGQMKLNLNNPNSEYFTEDGVNIKLPFSLKLKDFQINYYPGSKAPSDYVSEIEIIEKDGTTRDITISMNNIGKYSGYRFYQADYEEDMQTSILSVSHDPIGVSVTYLGYFLLLLGMLGFFFQKNSGFRQALSKLSATILVLILFVPNANSKSIENLPVVPKDVADEFSQLYVYYNDRICPFQTQARDYCLKAYGKATFNGYSAEQVVTSWMFYPKKWATVPFKIKKKDVGTIKEQEKHRIMMNAATGNAFKWVGCDEKLDQNNEIDLLKAAASKGDWKEVKNIISELKQYQIETAKEYLPSDTKVSAERLYNKICLPKIPFMTAITIGILLFVLCGIFISKKKQISPNLQKAIMVLGWILFAYLTVVLALRWFVSGQAPFAGTYSVMMLMAWLSCLAMGLFYKRLPLIQPLCFILAGFTMLVASLSGSNPKITHLMPVLQSPLLSIHVLSMMMSYTLLGLAMLNGIMGLVVKGEDAKVQLMNVSLVILYPAVFLLTFGTFVGAIWANISWGTYWAWDPKETWALITLLIYATALHGKSLKAFRKPSFFHIYCIIAFISVLITYFGVNLILGGMHSYA